MSINFCEKCDRAIVDGGKICVSCEQHKFKKGGNEGAISYHPGEKPYLAVTAVKSQWYKTYKGAYNFMERNGYKRTK